MCVFLSSMQTMAPSSFLILQMPLLAHSLTLPFSLFCFCIFLPSPPPHFSLLFLFLIFFLTSWSLIWSCLNSIDFGASAATIIVQAPFNIFASFYLPVCSFHLMVQIKVSAPLLLLFLYSSRCSSGSGKRTSGNYKETSPVMVCVSSTQFNYYQPYLFTLDVCTCWNRNQGRGIYFVWSYFLCSTE